MNDRYPNSSDGQPASLSPLERQVMQIIWRHEPVSADTVRRLLADEKELKDSTVRTLLRRMEEKGFLDHRTEGRTFIYSAKIPRAKAAAHAVRQVLDGICGGSLETLISGMVDDEILEPSQLEALAKKIDAAERAGAGPTTESK